MQNLFVTRTTMEKEKQRRICVAMWAYAYEFKNVSLVSDHQFDSTCREINPSIRTNRLDLDEFFLTKFHPDTGMWIHSHPELNLIERKYETLYARPRNTR